MRARHPRIGITLGDPAGIGAEVIAKALNKPVLNRLAQYWVIGDAQIFSRLGPIPQKINFIDLKTPYVHAIKSGHPSRLSGAASLSYLEMAVSLLKEKKFHALVTAPVCKEAVCLSLPHFQGHTEYLAKAFRIRHVDMMFVTKALRTILVTRHIPLSKVSECLTRQNIFKTIRLTDQSLKKHFGIQRPLIAVCGLNPHAGEGGNLGQEERTVILPAIRKARSHHIRVSDPLAADTLFYPDNVKSYHAVVAMYHDQGLIPIKTLHFHKAVNLTLGLPFIRTSPAHGTAFDLAGKNQANPSSMVEAIKLAALLIQ